MCQLRYSKHLSQLSCYRGGQCLVAERDGITRCADHDRQQSWQAFVELAAVEYELAPFVCRNIVDQSEEGLRQACGRFVLQIARGDRLVTEGCQITCVNQTVEQTGCV